MPEPSAEVWRAVRRLPERQRAALVLMVVEDRSVEEVAVDVHGEDVQLESTAPDGSVTTTALSQL